MNLYCITQKWIVGPIMKKRCQKLGETVSLNWRKNHWTIIRICIWLQGVIDTADSDSAVSVPSPCLTTPSFNSSWRPLLYNRLFSQSAFYMRKVYWTCTRVALSEVVRKSVLWHGKMEKGKKLSCSQERKEKEKKGEREHGRGGPFNRWLRLCRLDDYRYKMQYYNMQKKRSSGIQNMLPRNE